MKTFLFLECWNWEEIIQNNFPPLEEQFNSNRFFKFWFFLLMAMILYLTKVATFEGLSAGFL